MPPDAYAGGVFRLWTERWKEERDGRQGLENHCAGRHGLRSHGDCAGGTAGAGIPGGTGGICVSDDGGVRSDFGGSGIPGDTDAGVRRGAVRGMARRVCTAPPGGGTGISDLRLSSGGGISAHQGQETLSGKVVRVRADIRDPVRPGSLRDAVLPGIPERVFHAGHRSGRDDGAGADGTGAGGRGWKRRNGKSCRDGASCRGRRSC